jgi:UDP-N-acetylglucosamine 2-epimerase (non-hydrolysing)
VTSLKPLNIMIVTGTRPELVKMCGILRLAAKDPEITLTFVHSGQHYDDTLFGVFLRDLELPNPDYNIEVGSAPNAVQTANIILKLYEIVQKVRPDVILSQGDTNTVFAAALTAFKTDIPFGHVEAGIRSFDWHMPEEINRVLTSTCALLNFAPTPLAATNLVSAGVPPSRIFVVGNPVVDAVLQNLELAQRKSIIDKTLGIKPGEKIIVVTAHRPSNVDTKENFEHIIQGLSLVEGARVIFPIHPRSRARIKEFNLEEQVRQIKHIKLIEPLGYLDFLKLMSLASFFVTDSGGMQEEAVALKKPCLTLRENTERPETIETGGNVLVGNDPAKIQGFITKLLNDPAFYASMCPKNNPFGDGTSSQQMLAILKEHAKKGQLAIPGSSQFNKIPRYRLIPVQENKPRQTIQLREREQDCIIIEVFDSAGNLLLPAPNLVLRKGMFYKGLFFEEIKKELSPSRDA